MTGGLSAWNRRQWGVGVGACLLGVPWVAWAQSAPTPAPPVTPRPSLDLSAYQRPDGALLTALGSPEHIDPYFPLKALWLGARMGLDVSATWGAWASWMVAHQDADGRWGRWTLEEATTAGQPPRATRAQDADADDALLALWLQSVAEHGLPEPLCSPHLVGLLRAQAHLSRRLLDSRLGLYKVFAHEPAHLWMDNIEVWSAFRSLAARSLSWVPAWPDTATWQRRADDLASAMRRHLERRQPLSPRPSTQTLPEGPRFYPDHVAAPFAWLHGWPQPTPQAWPTWLQRHEAAWAAQADDDYPWGLVAVAAWQAGQREAACRWLDRAEACRHAERWHILEEAAWQGLQAWRSAEPT